MLQSSDAVDIIIIIIIIIQSILIIHNVLFL